MPEPFTVEIVLKAFALVGFGIFWLYRKQASERMGKITTDLEILEKSQALLGADNERSKQIDADITKLRCFDWANLIFGSFCVLIAVTFALFGWWGVQAGEANANAWQFAVAAVSGFIALGAFLECVGYEASDCTTHGSYRASGESTRQSN